MKELCSSDVAALIATWIIIRNPASIFLIWVLLIFVLSGCAKMRKYFEMRIYLAQKWSENDLQKWNEFL